MKTPANRLRNRVVLLSAGSTGLLLAVAVAFMHISGVSRVYERAAGRVKSDGASFAVEFTRAIEASAVELSAMRMNSPMSPGPGAEPATDTALVGNLRALMQAYPSRYEEVTLGGTPGRHTRRMSLVRAFDGEYHLRIDDDGTEPASLSFRLSAARSLRDLASECTAGVRGTSVALHVPPSGHLCALGASLSIAELTEAVLSQSAGIFASMPIVIDSGGVVMYSPTPVDRGQRLSVVRPETAGLPAGLATSEAVRRGDLLFARQPLLDGTLFVIMLYDSERDVRDIEAMTLRASLLASALLVAVTLILLVLAGRFSRSLREVTHVARQVASGDFSRTIPSWRDDELGVLIAAFNDMVFRLRDTYAELNRANLDLERKVDELTRTRTELSRSQRLALIGETVSRISHEIQNKVGGISIWVQNLELQTARNPLTSVYVAEVKKALSSFLSMLVSFKRLYRQPQLEPRSFDVSCLAQRLADGMNSSREGPRVVFHAWPPDRPIRITADPERLQEALENLLLNAIQHSPDGSTIDLCVGPEDGVLLITVADRGPGVPESIRERLFQPFVTTRHDGSGLGLAIAHAVITSHNGTLSYSPREGGGSSFEIRIPACIEPCQQSNHENPDRG